MLAFVNKDIGFGNSMCGGGSVYGDGITSGLYTDVEDVLVMYKKGDDLRQDRLTLQLLTVMDLLWKDDGMDLRLNLYKCMSTGPNEGLIEVVQKAETICRIQMKMSDYKSTAAFKKGLAFIKNCT